LRNYVLLAVTALVFTACSEKASVKYVPYKDRAQQQSGEPLTKQGPSVIGDSSSAQPVPSSATASSTLKPYTVMGKTYYPSTVATGEEYSGIASWYGPDFHGKKTASGEPYDMYADTAAHKTLPMNTIVRVTSIDNGKSAVVRINDRGPFVAGRIIDLSYSAGKAIGLDKTGTAPVKLTVLGFDGQVAKDGQVGQNRLIKGVAVQIGAFRSKTGADNYAADNSSVKGMYKGVVKTYDLGGSPIYRVMLTGFNSEAEARDFIKEGQFPGSFVVSVE